MGHPVLHNWRLIDGGADCLGILVGEVTGHPSLPNGWITTSLVCELAQDQSWARTISRLYNLGARLPEDQRLPAAATEAVLCRLLRNAGTQISVEKLAAFADQLSEAPSTNND